MFLFIRCLYIFLFISRFNFNFRKLSPIKSLILIRQIIHCIVIRDDLNLSFELYKLKNFSRKNNNNKKSSFFFISFNRFTLTFHEIFLVSRISLFIYTIWLQRWMRAYFDLIEWTNTKYLNQAETKVLVVPTGIR